MKKLLVVLFIVAALSVVAVWQITKPPADKWTDVNHIVETGEEIDTMLAYVESLDPMPRVVVTVIFDDTDWCWKIVGVFDDALEQLEKEVPGQVLFMAVNLNETLSDTDILNGKKAHGIEHVLFVNGMDEILDDYEANAEKNPAKGVPWGSSYLGYVVNGKVWGGGSRYGDPEDPTGGYKAGELASVIIQIVYEAEFMEATGQ